MFEGLKKKFSDLVGSIVKKEESAASEAPLAPVQQETKRVAEPKREEPLMEEPKMQAVQEEIKEIHEQSQQTIAQPEQAHRVQEKKQEEKPSIITEKPKLSVMTKIKSVITGKVTIKEGDIEELLEKFKFSLIEADVSYDVAEKLVEHMKGKLVGITVESSGINAYINRVVADSLYDILNKGSNADLVKMILQRKAKGEMPFRILFLGPNGAGKTTTIAKITSMLLANNLTCVLSASDTFRAAAIEQTVHHADKLNVKVIKGTYGADPASIAFDAISFAQAHKVDVVLMDTAGRQDTNKSLMDEMRKIVRVTKPDMKIFIGESVTGNAIIDQVREFNEAISLDGIILTKLDVDAKGGNTISILSTSPVPILYFGIGEKYTDLMRYTPELIIGNIVPKGS